MKKYLYISLFFVVLFLSSSIMVSCSGDGGDDTYRYDKEEKPEVQYIGTSYCELDSLNYNYVIFSIPVDEVIGGMAELTATPVDPNAAVAEIITGTYDSVKSCYMFNVDELIDNQTYIFKVRVYDPNGYVVIESDEIKKKMPDSSIDSYVDDNELSDGTRTW